MSLPRPFASLCLLLLAVSVGSASDATAAGPGSWNRGDQREVVEAALMVKRADGAFQGEGALGAAGMRRALALLAASRGTAPVGVPAGAVSVERFHALLVRQLGLSDVAARVRSQARRAGLRPPRRWLGRGRAPARVAPQPSRAPRPARAVPVGADHPRRGRPHARARATAGWGEAAHVRGLAEVFVLPRYGAHARAALRVAVAKVGVPYVWGGETDARSSAFGPQAHGGYDCSGFVWRVFKLTGHPAVARIVGRTAGQMAGEVPRAARIPADRIDPADLLFFGSAGFGSRAAERSITHVGIALSRDFMISSRRACTSPDRGAPELPFVSQAGV